MSNPIQTLGAFGLDKIYDAGRFGVFLLYTLRGIFRPPAKFWPVVKQLEFLGSKSILLVGFTAAFTGMVLALQGYYTLSQYGSEGYVGAGVGLSLVRELGPVLSALMVTGRAGSAIAAEIGIMRIEEQIDALECMAIDAHAYLVVPRFIASLIAMPLLVAYCDVVGILGGHLVGVSLLGVSSGAYWDGFFASVFWSDVYMGLIKSLCFSILIVWICTYKGFYAGVAEGHFGPEAVSRATTNAVVLSSISILISDYVITSVLLYS